MFTAASEYFPMVIRMRRVSFVSSYHPSSGKRLNVTKNAVMSGRCMKWVNHLLFISFDVVRKFSVL